MLLTLLKSSSAETLEESCSDFKQLRSGASDAQEQEVLDINDRTQWLKPACVVHVGKLTCNLYERSLTDCPDQSTAGVVHRVQVHLKDQANFLLQGRVRLIK